MKRPFAVIGFTVFLTIAFLFDKETGVTVAAFAAFAVALVIALFSKKLRKAKIVPICTASGAVACVFLIAFNTLVLAPMTSFAGGTYRMKAQITDEAVLEYGKYYYGAKALTIDGKEAGADVRLVFSVMPDIKPYDYVEGEFAFYLPGVSDEIYLNANRSNGLILGAYPVSGEIIIHETPDSERPLGYRIIEFRNEIKKAIYKVFPDEKGALAVAMILGDKSAVPSDIYNDLRISGVVHLICVSGLHLSLWATLILAFLRRIGLREKVACVAVAAGVLGFMTLTGFTYSVLRAGIMMLAYLTANFISRKPDSINSLGFSLLVISVISPYAMASVALQLSVLSTLGIVAYREFVYPEIELYFEKITYKKLKSALLTVTNALLVAVSATLLIQPVMLKLMGGFNFATVISNLIITPFAGGAMITSAVGALAGLFLPQAINPFYYIGKVFLQYIISVSGLIADMEFFRFNLNESESSTLLGVLFIFCAFAFYLACLFKPKPVVASGLACLIFFSGVLIPSCIRRNETQVRIIDTGNGVSVLFSHSGETVLVGCGGTSFMGGVKIFDALRTSGNVDCLVIPSAHGVSSAYAVDIIKECRPDNIVFEELPENAELLIGRSNVHSFTETYKTDNFTLSFCELKGKRFILVETDDISSLICAFPVDNLSDLPIEFRNARLLVCRGDYPSDISAHNVGFAAFCAENNRGIIIQNEIESKGVPCAATGGCGDLVISAAKGDISIRRE